MQPVLPSSRPTPSGGSALCILSSACSVSGGLFLRLACFGYNFSSRCSDNHFLLVVADRKPNARCAHAGCEELHPRIYSFNSMSYEVDPRELNGIQMVLTALDDLKSKGMDALLKAPADEDGIVPPPIEVLASLRKHWGIHHVQVCITLSYSCQCSS